MEFDNKTKSELGNLVSWLQNHELQVSSYVPKNALNHPILKQTQIIDEIILAIKSGDLNAIELGCDLVIENKQIPFGKILKSKILRSLKSQTRFISSPYRQQLTELTIKLLSLEFHPTETKYLCRLVKAFEPKYHDCIINKVTKVSEENQRWLNYFGYIEKTN